MCNLYRMNAPIEAIAKLFLADEQKGANFSNEIYPGYPGVVVADGVARTMAWGFPLILKSKKTGQPLKPKPVNNTRTDKLHIGFWRDSFVKRRCLIPVSAFAEAEGPKGHMTRTWLSLPDRPVFACAGIWRESAEWGPVYSMVMTDAGQATAEVHDRVPVILKQEDEEAWTAGEPDEAFALCRPWTDAINIDRTTDSWVRRS